MAVTADDVFKIVTVNKRDYTVTYGGKIIRDDGKVIQKTGGLAKHILREAGWHKGVLEDANQPVEEEADELAEYEGAEEEKESTGYWTVIKGVLKWIKEEFIPTKQREFEPGIYIEKDIKVYQVKDNGDIVEHEPDGSISDVKRDSDLYKGIRHAIIYNKDLVPTTFGSPEFVEALDRQAFTTWERTLKLAVNYSIPKTGEDFVNFVGNLVANVADLPAEIYNSFRTGNWDEELQWDPHLQLSFTSKYGRQLAEQMIDKGDPNRDILIRIIVAIPVELLAEGAIAGLINQAGRATKAGKLSVKAYEVEGDNVDWDKFFDDPEAYVANLGKYVETPPVPKDTTKVNTRSLNRLKGSTAIPTNVPTVTTRVLQRTPLVIPEGLPKVRHRELKRLKPRVPENTTKVKTNNLIRRTETTIPVGSLRVQTRVVNRKRRRYTDAQVRVRTRRLERLQRLEVPDNTTRVQTRTLPRRKVLEEISPGVYKVKTKPLPKWIDAPLTLGAGKVTTRKLTRILSKIDETIIRVKANVLRPLRRGSTTSARKIRTRTLKRLGQPIPSFIQRVKTRIRDRIKYSAIGDLSRVVVKTRKLKRTRRAAAIATAIIVETRALRRTVSSIPSVAIRIPVTAIRVLNRATLGVALNVALLIPRIAFRVLKRRSKLVQNISAKIKLAKRKIRVLRRSAGKTAISAAIHVTARVIPRLRYVNTTEPEPQVPLEPLSIEPVEPVTGGGRGIFRPTSTAPVRGAGKLKGNVLGVGGRTYTPGTGQRKARGRIT